MTHVIILYDRMFEQYRIYYPNGAWMREKTFDKALATIGHFTTLKEVPLNSKEGQKILNNIGSALDM